MFPDPPPFRTHHFLFNKKKCNSNRFSGLWTSVFDEAPKCKIGGGEKHGGPY